MLYENGYHCACIHGEKSQVDRSMSIEKFKLGKVPILIATDVVGRGIDFSNANYVINFDTPKNIDDYIHRIGRTGRCGQKGCSISFINMSSKPILKDLSTLLRNNEIEVPKFFREILIMSKSTSFSNEKPLLSSIMMNEDLRLVNENPLFSTMNNGEKKLAWRK